MPNNAQTWLGIEALRTPRSAHSNPFLNTPTLTLIAAPQGGIDAGGIASADARNPFARWNHAFVCYSNSCGWTGRAW